MNAALTPHVLAAALGQPAPTDAQARVISSPLQPSLVIAGAGSGKTETMAGRVVWLVANGLVRRDEVLGLTFTRKAAGELAERIHRRLRRLGEFERRGLLPALPGLHARGALDVFGEIERAGAGERAWHDALQRLGTVDADAAPAADALLDRPVVATYNSFADQIVREHAVRAGHDPEAVVLTESAAWLLMRRVVLDSDDPRLEELTESLSTIIDAALRIARDGVDNLVDLDALAAFPARFAGIAELPSVSKRVTVYKEVGEAVAAVGGLAPLVELAREYAAQKRRRGLIDFSDQVAGACRLVREHAAVRDDLRTRHRAVLLDEYQDTSVVQTELLAAAFAGGAVMAVGDPHQSIYGWRGASAGNLGGFAAAFAAGGGEPASAGAAGAFSLMTSWRNSVRVLDAAQAVLAPLAASAPVRVDPLEPRPGAPAGEVEIVVERDVDAEADRVAEWFSRVRAARGRATTGAVLFRSKRHMTRFADALARHGIPHRILGMGGLLSTPEVVDVVSALRVIADPQAGSALLRLLGGPRWRIGIADLRALAELADRLTRHDAALQPLQREHRADDASSLIDALDFVGRSAADHGWLASFTPEAVARLRDAAGVFAGLRRQAGLPVAELVRLIESELRLDIELAANEARGPARVAGDQLRAFVDELHGFLASDDNTSLTSLLAWIDRAERVDEFAPRTEPPEDDVVQLLTVHGSKGLEWDAVAVVRLVEDELPGALRETKGWLRFGVLPSEFRGDAAWLPRFAWATARTQQDLKALLDGYVEQNRAHHLDEERRLAYVAVTRARDHLLLSSSAWSGARRPRPASRFLAEIATALGNELAEQDAGDDPYLGERKQLVWPLDPLGARRPVVERAAALVRAALDAPRREPGGDLALLLAERDDARAGAPPVVPDRIPASRFKDVRADGGASFARPLPERPYRQTRVGTRFHAWIEQRSGLAGAGSSLDDALWDDDALADDVPHDGEEAQTLDALKEAFLASEWAGLQPVEVESEIDFVLPDALGDGQDRIVICKLDAVYRRGDRVEIVDWKTGAAPRTAAQREARMLQLELYRTAYHAARGVPLEQIDVALFYVAEGLVLRG
ncbi:ATP-dependent DNA helicase [Microbacterium sp. No. 7]|uniref:ATP-dependent DNA helicase n=1 Tax=Microbacterium sp. No. 7 TaxID=1714373 RepID=UPI0006CFAC1C|nr:ATP-dependent DNA helicase [Microbacterium sp. No. 7]ALJ19963.1 ATP-dependent DNA helicase [Microbacterium sp. No. 7]